MVVKINRERVAPAAIRNEQTPISNSTWKLGDGEWAISSKRWRLVTITANPSNAPRTAPIAVWTITWRTDGVLGPLGIIERRIDVTFAQRPVALIVLSHLTHKLSQVVSTAKSTMTKRGVKSDHKSEFSVRTCTLGSIASLQWSPPDTGDIQASMTEIRDEWQMATIVSVLSERPRRH